MNRPPSTGRIPVAVSLWERKTPLEQGEAAVTEFGQNLRRLRGERGLTQAQLAAAVGLSMRSKGYISELESGRKEPKLDLLVAFANYFQVSVDELLGLPRPPCSEREGAG